MGVAEADADALSAALAVELAEADGDPVDDPDPLGAAEALVLGSGVALGVGKRLLGMFANDRAKISTKMTNTTTTQGRARVSVRGGRAPR